VTVRCGKICFAVPVATARRDGHWITQRGQQYRGMVHGPELLSDTRPGPVALRMVAALGADEKQPEPALIVLQNPVLAACL
jgi:hypothetical protein